VSGIMEMMPPGMSQPPLNEFGRMASIWLCLDATTDREMKSHRQIKKGLGGVSLHPLLFHCLKFPHQSTNEATNQNNFCSPGSKLGNVGATTRGLSQFLLWWTVLICECSHPKGIATANRNKKCKNGAGVYSGQGWSQGGSC
jgi:hypothetical protein